MEENQEIDSTKRVINRKQNSEDTSPFLCNLFYCFYFRYVCRVSPVTDEVIPSVTEQDHASLATDKLRDKWAAAQGQYEAKLKEYEAKSKNKSLFGVVLLYP